MNPYGQGQWQQGGAAPSIFGALPSASTTTAPNPIADSVTFTFTNFKTTILNSTIVGPQGRTVYRVVTETTAPACTIFKDNESRNVAMVQWQPNASVEIRGVAAQQRVRDWLKLSPDQRCVGCSSDLPFHLSMSLPRDAMLMYMQCTAVGSWKSGVCNTLGRRCKDLFACVQLVSSRKLGLTRVAFFFHRCTRSTLLLLASSPASRACRMWWCST